MEEQVMNLSVHPQILDLYTVLEQNGLSKQKEEILKIWKTNCPRCQRKSKICTRH